MNEEFIDFVANLSNYTGRSLEETFSINDRQEIIKQILNSYQKLALKEETLNSLNDNDVKYIKVLFDALNDILQNNKKFN